MLPEKCSLPLTRPWPARCSPTACRPPRRGRCRGARRRGAQVRRPAAPRLHAHGGGGRGAGGRRAFNARVGGREGGAGCAHSGRAPAAMRRARARACAAPRLCSTSRPLTASHVLALVVPPDGADVGVQAERVPAGHGAGQGEKGWLMTRVKRGSRPCAASRMARGRPRWAASARGVRGARPARATHALDARHLGGVAGGQVGRRLLERRHVLRQRRQLLRRQLARVAQARQLLRQRRLAPVQQRQARAHVVQRRQRLVGGRLGAVHAGGELCERGGARAPVARVGAVSRRQAAGSARARVSRPPPTILPPHAPHL